MRKPPLGWCGCRRGRRIWRAPPCGLRGRPDLRSGAGLPDRHRAQHVFRGQGGTRGQAGAPDGGTISPLTQRASSKTGLNRDCSGTFFGLRPPPAPPARAWHLSQLDRRGSRIPPRAPLLDRRRSLEPCAGPFYRRLRGRRHGGREGPKLLHFLRARILSHVNPPQKPIHLPWQGRPRITLFS